MPTPNLDEYLALDGLPLQTPAWDLLNLWVLWNSAPLRGNNDVIPYRRGVRPRRKIEGPKRATLELAIVGTVDSDDNPAPAGSERIQLEANIGELETVLRPRQNSATGLIVAELHTPTLVLTGPAQVVTGLSHGPLGPGGTRATFDVELVDGVLYDEATPVDVTEVDAPDGLPTDFVVPNPGTADQLATVITLTGTATSVRLINLTWDPAGDTWLEFGGNLEDTGVGTVITTDDFTADRNGLSVVGLINQSGHERWLPLLAGVDNTIRIEPVGGTATVQVEHNPAYR